jgi:hypothetical protein
LRAGSEEEDEPILSNRRPLPSPSPSPSPLTRAVAAGGGALRSVGAFTTRVEAEAESDGRGVASPVRAWSGTWEDGGNDGVARGGRRVCEFDESEIDRACVEGGVGACCMAGREGSRSRGGGGEREWEGGGGGGGGAREWEGGVLRGGFFTGGQSEGVVAPGMNGKSWDDKQNLKNLASPRFTHHGGVAARLHDGSEAHVQVFEQEPVNGWSATDFQGNKRVRMCTT